MRREGHFRSHEIVVIPHIGMNDSTERWSSMVKDKLGAAAASAPKGDQTGKYTLNG
jgi:hypothetical protein